jgi:hypothetical protein
MKEIERRRLLFGGLSASALLAGRGVAETPATAPSSGAVIQDKGRLTALDSPEIRQIAAKYPGRPGV